MNFYKWCEVGAHLYCFACGYPVAPAPSVEWSWPTVEDQWTADVRVSQALSSIPLIGCLSIPQYYVRCLDYSSFAVSFEICNYKSSNWVLLF